MKWLTFDLQASAHLACRVLTTLLLCFAYVTRAKAQSADFHWLSPKTDPATWAKIQDAFKGVLQPDDPNSNGDVVFGFKFLERVGLVDHCALVIIGHKTAKVPRKDDVDERYSSAFSFDLDSGTITKVEHAEWMWHWKFKKLARWEPIGTADVAFTYLTCWECEPSEVLSTVRYDTASKKWLVREWEADKMIWWTGEDGLVVNADILEGADDTVSFECLYGVTSVHGGPLDEVASRCREITEIDSGKKIVTDITVLYSLSGGVLKVTPVTSLPEVTAVTAKLCEEKRANSLCKLPPASTYNSSQLTIFGMFPHAAKTTRDVKCFQTLQGDISMYAIVEKCGRPDRGGGTAVGFFDYRMDDGSQVTIHWTDLLHVLDLVQSDKSGNKRLLFARKM